MKRRTQLRAGARLHTASRRERTSIGAPSWSCPCRAQGPGQAYRADNVATEELDQRHQRGRRRTDPVRERRGLERYALSSVDLGLAIQGKVIVELRYDDVSEKPRTGAAPCNRVMRCGRLDDALAGAAREGLAHVAYHLEAPGNVVERLGDVRPDPPQGPAAARASAGTGM